MTLFLIYGLSLWGDWTVIAFTKLDLFFIELKGYDASQSVGSNND